MFHFFSSIENPILQAFIATLFTWMMTALGASLVFLFKKTNKKTFDSILGFTGGVMIAASFCSLLIPSLSHSETQVASIFPSWFPPTVGLMSGALFLMLMDRLVPDYKRICLDSTQKKSSQEDSDWKCTLLLVVAMTVHHMPEGLAVGVAFGALAHNIPGYELGSAIALMIGTAIQNFPEGFAVSMPLRRQGLSAGKSFFWGQLSSIVEPKQAAAVAAATALRTL